MYIDDIRIFAINKIKKLKRSYKDIQIEFGIEECTILTMKKKGKRIEQINEGKIRTDWLVDFMAYHLMP